MGKIISSIFICCGAWVAISYNNRQLQITANVSQPDSCLVGEWLMYYEHAYDRVAGEVEPERELMTVFRENGEFLDLAKKDTLTVGHWQIKGDSIALTYRTIIPRDDRERKAYYHIHKLSCDTLIVTFNTWFGTGSGEYKKLKK
jgi:hypothetical protein